MALMEMVYELLAYELAAVFAIIAGTLITQRWRHNRQVEQHTAKFIKQVKRQREQREQDLRDRLTRDYGLQGTALEAAISEVMTHEQHIQKALLKTYVEQEQNAILQLPVQIEAAVNAGLNLLPIRPVETELAAEFEAVELENEAVVPIDDDWLMEKIASESEPEPVISKAQSEDNEALTELSQVSLENDVTSISETDAGETEIEATQQTDFTDAVLIDNEPVQQKSREANDIESLFNDDPIELWAEQQPPTNTKLVNELTSNDIDALNDETIIEIEGETPTQFADLSLVPEDAIARFGQPFQQPVKIDGHQAGPILSEQTFNEMYLDETREDEALPPTDSVATAATEPQKASRGLAQFLTSSQFYSTPVNTQDEPTDNGIDEVEAAESAVSAFSQAESEAPGLTSQSDDIKTELELLREKVRARTAELKADKQPDSVIPQTVNEDTETLETADKRLDASEERVTSQITETTQINDESTFDTVQMAAVTESEQVTLSPEEVEQIDLIASEEMSSFSTASDDFAQDVSENALIATDSEPLSDPASLPTYLEDEQSEEARMLAKWAEQLGMDVEDEMTLTHNESDSIQTEAPQSQTDFVNANEPEQEIIDTGPPVKLTSAKEAVSDMLFELTDESTLMADEETWSPAPLTSAQEKEIDDLDAAPRQRNSRLSQPHSHLNSILSAIPSFSELNQKSDKSVD